MTHKPPPDLGQADLFGRAPQPVAAKVKPARRPGASPALAGPPPLEARDVPAAVSPDRPHPAAPVPAAPIPAALPAALPPPAEMSPADLAALAVDASDEALAVLVVAAVRQLRRRLARGGARHGPKPSPALHRAAGQLAAEFGGTADDDGF